MGSGYSSPAIVIEMTDKAEDKGKSEARVRVILGNLLRRKGNYQEALGLLQEAKQLSEQALDDRMPGDAVYYLGELHYIEAFYMHKRDRNEALEFHNEALALRKKADDRRGVVHSLSRLGTIYEQTGKPDQALEFHNEAIRVANEIGLVFTLGSIGDTLCKLDKNYIHVALQLCAHSLALGENLDFKLGICRTHLLMGGLYLECGEQDDAKERFRKAAELAASVGYQGFRSAAEKSIIELENKD